MNSYELEYNQKRWQYQYVGESNVQEELKETCKKKESKEMIDLLD